MTDEPKDRASVRLTTKLRSLERWLIKEEMGQNAALVHKAADVIDRRTDTAEEERAVLTELLRLYDWRFELAKDQKEFERQRDLGFAPRARLNALEKNLARYGREKKAAWDRAREVLARRTGGKDK